MSEGKAIIISAPSGAGKSTIVKHLMKQNFNLAFSVSATSRAPRGNEKHGVEYFFLSPVDFRKKIENEEFVEHNEVYADTFYGTLKSEVEGMLLSGKNILFDVDVKGGMNLKRYFGSRALAVFIMPPSVETLYERLMKRGTDAPEVIHQRLARATKELEFAPQFDVILLNDSLQQALNEAQRIVTHFLHEKKE